MGIYIEFLILYIVLFFSGSAGSFLFAGQEAAGFSTASELRKIFLYCVPSLALIWYLLLKVKPARLWDITPAKKDLISGAITLPCLLMTGFAVAFASSYTGGVSGQTPLYSPLTKPQWVILCFSCITAAYLEESFFRFYILSRRDEMKLGTKSALVISVALFSICHLYEGPWGFLNAVLSGTFLCLIFLKFRAFHGNAIAHGMYNIAVYIINALMTNQTG
jgi:membrane protease YdiL (CAAX protease family)